MNMAKSTPHDHEEFLVNRLIDHTKKERLKSLLNSKKGRVKLRKRLAHNIDFDSRFITKIPTSKQTTYQILESLKGGGASDQCYVISENNEIDGKILGLEEALYLVVGSGMGSLISCLPGKLVYFEGEAPNQRFIVKRDD